MNGTVITFNIITDEDIDIAINTPANIEVHDNSLFGGKVGVGNVCSFDGASICGGVIDATRNYWGCSGGPSAGGACSTYSGNNILYTPWSPQPVANGKN